MGKLLCSQELLVLLKVLTLLLSELDLPIENISFLLVLLLLPTREVVVTAVGTIKHRGVWMWVVMRTLHMGHCTLLHD